MLALQGVLHNVLHFLIKLQTLIIISWQHSQQEESAIILTTVIGKWDDLSRVTLEVAGSALQ